MLKPQYSIVLIVCLLFACIHPLCADDANQTYDIDIPADEARKTLREFSMQLRVSLVFSQSEIGSEITNEIFGEFSAIEALELMLKGTALSFNVDGASSAIAVFRKKENTSPISTELKSSNSEVPNHKHSKHTDTTNMNNKIREKSKLLSAVFSIIMASGTVAGQQDGAVDDDFYELSPFVVETSEDGYTATSTLAGTRIKTDVSDIGSSISILTGQLMEDVGGTDAASLLNIVPNMEVAGELGNFSGASFDADTESYQAGSRENSNSTQRVRGLASAQTTRNYFQTIIPFDTYNTSQVTVNRGPNSVLFGLGSPGGVIENSIAMPGHENFTKLQLRFSNYGGHRESFDVNRVFLDGKLKVRAALLNEDRQYRQKEAYKEDERYFVAWDYKLRDADRDAVWGDTTFRGYLETGKQDRNSPDPIPPSVGYAYWYDISYYQNLVGNYPGYDSIDDLELWGRTPEQGGFWTPQGTVINTDRSSYTNTLTSTPAYIDLVEIFSQPDAASPSIYEFNGFMPRSRWGGTRSTQDSKRTSAQLGVSGFSVPALQDRNVFDFVDHLYYGNTDTLLDDFDVQEFTLEQEMFGGNMGVEISYNKQSVESTRFTPFSSGRSRIIAIDVSPQVSIPVSVPTTAGDSLAEVRGNPNFGRPFMAINGFSRSFTERDLETFRATAYFKHDFRDSLGEKVGKWIGTHTVSALFSSYEDTNKRLRETLNWDGVGIDVGANNILNNAYHGGRRTYNSFIYVGDEVLSTSSADQVRLNFPLSNSVIPQAGVDRTFTYWDNATKQQNVLTARSVWVPDMGSDISREKVESDAFILQSHWLDGHFITLFAVRNDDVSNYEIIPEGNTKLPSGAFDVETHILQDTPSFEQSGETKTQSYVLKFPEKYLFELPWDADLSFSYFESETFQPSSIARSIDGSILANPNGTTEEYGVNLDLFNRRLSVSINWYETGSNAARLSTGLSTFQGWFGSGGNWVERASDFEQEGWSIEDLPGAEDAGFTSWEQYYDAILSITPQSYRDNIDVAFNRETGEVDGTGIEGLNSTFDFVSKGIELELAGAITDNWSIVFNVAKQETVKSNVMPGVLEAYNAVRANLIATGLANVVDSPSNTGELTTFADRWDDFVFDVRGEKAGEGEKTPEQRKWRWNLVNSYRFDDGFLDGTTVGCVARWQDKSAIGYPVIENEDGNLVNDIKNPYFGDTEFNADIWVSYKRKIWNDKIDWKIQLNVRNLIGGDPDDFIPISKDPFGNVQAIRTSPERQILLTNTFEF